jgi:hypothetical protein
MLFIMLSHMIFELIDFMSQVLYDIIVVPQHFVAVMGACMRLLV